MSKFIYAKPINGKDPNGTLFINVEQIVSIYKSGDKAKIKLIGEEAITLEKPTCSELETLLELPPVPKEDNR